MQTVARMAERLDMTAEQAVEKLRYMLFEVESVESEISDDQCDLLIDVDDDPDLVEEYRKQRLAEEKKAQQRAERARKASLAKKKKAEAEKAEAERLLAEHAEEAAADAAPAAVAGAPYAQIMTDAEVADAAAAAAEPMVATLPPAPAAPEDAPAAEPVAPKKAKPEKKREPKPSVAPFLIGSAIDRGERAVEIVRADGSHVDVPEIEPEALVVEPEVEEEDEDSLIAEAERRQEEEELRLIRSGKAVPKPDPAVVAEVIRKAQERKAQERKPKPTAPRPVAAAGAGMRTRKATGKTARKRQKRQEKMRHDEELRRSAAAAVREYQAGLASGTKKRKRRRTRDEEGDGVDVMEKLLIEISDTITVEQLAEQMDYGTNDLILELMEFNVLATKNQVLDLDLVRQLAEAKGYEVEVVIPEEEALYSEEADEPADLRPRAPVITVMGHVDHGKTSLLDVVRRATVAEGEAGGITQHIAAYDVAMENGRVVFLDTPGHEAFTQLRARGAKITDVVVLVVAADDGVMPQTVEAIHHARAAEVSIVVAVNKIDKPNAQPDRIRQELAQHDLLDEQWGGKTVIRNISAKTGEGITELMEMLVLESELLELKANPNKRARGTVVESEISRGQGPVAWVLVQNGTLRVGDAFLCGDTYGRVRNIINSRGEMLREALPSTPVVVTGFTNLPDAGQKFIVVEDERVARSIAEKRSHFARQRHAAPAPQLTLEDFHLRLMAGEHHELNVVVKGDVQGSVETLVSSLSKLGNEEVGVNVVHAAVGSINESDVMLASASKAVILGFNVSANPKVLKIAEHEGVDIRQYAIIYELIDNVHRALEGMLTPGQAEVVTGHAEIRAVFSSSAIGNIAGCYVLDGEILRNSLVRVKRGDEILHESKVVTLRRNRDDVRSVAPGYECGIKVDGFEAIQEGDILETYRIESVAKKLE
jgi:translation initiation factor IF-2